ncbi:MAG: ThuA domain-containing protein [Opitutales bacterium]
MDTIIHLRFLKRGRRLLASTLASIIAIFVFSACASISTDTDETLKVLFITGGGWHDFSDQEKVLAEGLSERLNIEFTIDHTAGSDPSYRPERFDDPDWVKGYDLVLYNMSLSRRQQSETAQAIIDSHVKHGVPAVLLHGSTHSYRHTGNENWFNFLGAKSMSHEAQGAFTNEVLQPDHPVMQGFPNPWAQEQGELYRIEAVMPTATVLTQAMGKNPERYQPTIWVNEYAGVRVFVTTIGHHTATMASDTYLDLLTRGILWAVGRVD